MLSGLYVFRAGDNQECDFQIKNNPLLKVDCEDRYLSEYSKIEVSGNLENCGKSRFLVLNAYIYKSPYFIIMLKN